MKIAELNHGEALVDTKTGKPAGLGSLLLSSVNKLIGRTGGINGHYLPLESRTVAQLNALALTGPAIAFCSNETGGATLVYYANGAGEWRRVYDNAVIVAA